MQLNSGRAFHPGWAQLPPGGSRVNLFTYIKEALLASDNIMPKKQGDCDKWFDGESVSDESFTRRDQSLKKLKGSILKYLQPFDPVGISDCKVVLLEGLTPEAVHADTLANPTMGEPGHNASKER